MSSSRDTIAIGVLFSTVGPYAALGLEGLGGAMVAIAEINEDEDYPFRLAAHARDPAGVTDRYAPLCADIVATAGARHVIGCTTSWSRKDVIPVLEKSGTVLWYPCPYEGFESNEQVIYLGACPNQHILPLLTFILPRFGDCVYLVGSNYIWGWETSRIARDIVEHSGGTIAGERFVPLGDTDIGRIIEEIRARRPDFILNTLIGSSSYAFLSAYRQLGRDDPAFDRARRPVISCNFAESEAAALGDIAAGQYAIAPYFHSLPTPQNAAFLKTAHRLAPQVKKVSAFFAQAYSAVHLVAMGIRAAGTAAPQEVQGAVRTLQLDSPLGPLRIDAATNHAILTPRIGRSTAEGSFEIVEDSGVAVVPDPYLAHSDIAIRPGARAGQAGHLRVVK